MAEKLKNISRMNRLYRGSVVFGEVVYAPGGMCGPRLQRHFQLVAMHSGELDLKLDGKSIHVAAGHAILLSPHHREHFAFSESTETRHSWCAIRPSVLPAGLRKRLRTLDSPIPFVGRMTTLLKWGCTNVDASEKFLQDEFCLGLGLALMGDFALAARRENSKQTPRIKALSRLENFINTEYSRPLSLKELAKEAGVSPQHLLKLCRLQKIASPTQQLYAKRLEASTDLLSHTGLSIEEVSERCGFVNPFHFSRKFRQTYGQSPFAWRKELWTRA